MILSSAWLFSTSLYASLDEFTVVHDGLRLLAGEVIYRDFFQFIPPGTAYISALGLLLTPHSLLGPRLLQEIGFLVAALALYRLARLMGVGCWLAIVPAITPALVFHLTFPGVSHHGLVLPFFCTALTCAATTLTQGSARWLFAAGCLAACTLLTMQSDGVVLIVALCGALGLDAWAEARPLGVLGRRLAALFAGLVSVLGVVGVYFSSLGALGSLLYDVWVWPLHHYRTPGGVNDVRFGSDLARYWYPEVGEPHFIGLLFGGLLYGGVVGTTVAGGAWLAGALHATRGDRPRWGLQTRTTALCIPVAFGLLFVAAHGNANTEHVMFYAWPSILLATVGASAAARKFAQHPTTALLRWLPAAVVVLFMGVGVAKLAATIARTPQNWGHFSAPDAALADTAAIRWLRAQARPGDRLMAWPFAGSFGMYALPVVGRWNLILPPWYGYNSLAEYRSFWEDVQRFRPRFIVWAPNQIDYPRQDWMPWPFHGYHEAIRLDGGRTVIFERTIP